jgi:hypothetical protein
MALVTVLAALACSSLRISIGLITYLSLALFEIDKAEYSITYFCLDYLLVDSPYILKVICLGQF